MQLPIITDYRLSWFYRSYLYHTSRATIQDINDIINTADRGTWVYVYYKPLGSIACLDSVITNELPHGE